MASTEMDATIKVVEKDFNELFMPLFLELVQKMRHEHALRGSVSFKLRLIHNQKSKDFTAICTAETAAGHQKIEHKARIDDKQLTFLS